MKKRIKILAADIGATKTLLGIFDYHNDTLMPYREEKFITNDCQDFGKLINNFLKNNEKPQIICLGVAGPVMNGKVNITNGSLKLDKNQLSTALGIPVYFINDLEATAYGVSQLKPDGFNTIHRGKRKPTGNIAVIAPGTGLGEGAAWWDGTTFHPFATEGGHCDFSVRNLTDFEILEYLQQKYEHVSWERLLSGPGIINLFEFLREKKGITIPIWLSEKLAIEEPAIVISSNAEEIAICKETMQLFFRFLAIESAHLALKTKSTGGLFIGGGIIPQILPLLDKQSFIDQFTDFGRLHYLLNSIPIKIIINIRAALLGAAAWGILSKKEQG
jgi:glucokinase